MRKVTRVPSDGDLRGKGGKTLLVMHELYPSKEASTPPARAADAMGETFEQLDEVLVTLGESVGRS
jgi:hypothetical protein